MGSKQTLKGADELEGDYHFQNILAEATNALAGLRLVRLPKVADLSGMAELQVGLLSEAANS